MSDNADPNRVVAGLKATTKNPRVSEEAKASAEERLSELQGDIHAQTSVQDLGKNASNRLGGYKATLSNPRTSKEAKQHAQKVLETYKKEGEMDDPDYVPPQGEQLED